MHKYSYYPALIRLCIALLMMSTPAQGGVKRSGAKQKYQPVAMATPPAPKKATPARKFACPEISKTEDLKLIPNTPTAIVFTSNYCAMCEEIQAPFNNFVNQSKGSVNCFSVNVDLQETQEIVNTLKITGVPSIVVLHKHMGAGAAEAFLIRSTNMQQPMTMVQEEVQIQNMPADNLPEASEVADSEVADDEPSITLTDKPLIITPEDIAPIQESTEMDLIITNSNKRPVGRKSTITA